MGIRVSELQDNNKEAIKLRLKGLSEGWEDIKQMLHYQDLPYIPKVICSELINRHYNDPLVGHFGIKKTCKLIARKYYWLTLWRDIKVYIKGYNIRLASKVVYHKPYGDLQLLSVPTYWWKDLSIDFVTGLPISANWKSDSYDLILVIINRLTKMVHYKLVKVTIDAPGLREVIINVVVRHHGVLKSIVTDWGLLFTSKFWSLLCYFLRIKKRLSTTFHPQTNDQTERQNSTIEVYLRAFVNWE